MFKATNTEVKERIYMALSRKFLSAMGIEADKIDEIIQAHVDTVNSIKEERDSLSEKLSDYDKTKKDLEKANNKITELSKEDVWKDKYDLLDEQFKDYKKNIEGKEVRSRKEMALTKILEDSKYSKSGIEKILKYSDIESIEIGEDGSISNKDDILNNINSEWGMFVETEQKTGAKVSTPPNNETKTFSREDIKGMSASEINANYDAIKASLKQN